MLNKFMALSSNLLHQCCDFIDRWISVDAENEKKEPSETKPASETVDLKEMKRVDVILTSLYRKVRWRENESALLYFLHLSLLIVTNLVFSCVILCSYLQLLRHRRFLKDMLVKKHQEKKKSLEHKEESLNSLKLILLSNKVLLKESSSKLHQHRFFISFIFIFLLLPCSNVYSQCNVLLELLMFRNCLEGRNEELYVSISSLLLILTHAAVNVKFPF